jgi:hypothetical protein
MVSDAPQMAEPKFACRGQDTPFVRDPVGQDVIEGADAIGANDHQSIAEVVDVANLATASGKRKVGP